MRAEKRAERLRADLAAAEHALAELAAGPERDRLAAEAELLRDALEEAEGRTLSGSGHPRP